MNHKIIKEIRNIMPGCDFISLKKLKNLEKMEYFYFLNVGIYMEGKIKRLFCRRLFSVHISN